MAPGSSRRWRLANVPVPWAHLVGLVAGLLLHARRPRRLVKQIRLVRVAGALSIGVGLATCAWAVRAVGDQDVADPDALVTTGPYEYSRNPMYVGWTALFVGLTLVANSVWPALLSPGVLAWTHRTVRQEERSLELTFGDAYRTYRKAVRRYG